MLKRVWLILLLIGSVIVAKSETQIKTEIAEQRANIAETEGKKAGIIDFLDGLCRQTTLVEDLLSKLAEEDSVLSKRLSVLNDSLEVSRARLDTAIDAQSNVVRAMFMHGRGREAAFILGGDSFAEFTRRLNLFIFLAKARGDLSRDIAAKKVDVEELIDSTQAIKVEVEANRELKMAERDSLKSIGARKKGALEKIRRDEESYRKAIAGMEKSLAELARRLPQPALSGNFAAMKGSIPWPSKSRRILHGFGIVKEKRFGTSFRNAGIDIATKPEEEVIAVADGRIAQIYWLRGYGRIVIIEHGGGYFSVYGNLGSLYVSSGQSVSGSDPIGRTAADGWLEGAKLHFEIRKGRQEVDPIEWLVTA